LGSQLAVDDKTRSHHQSVFGKLLDVGELLELVVDAEVVGGLSGGSGEVLAVRATRAKNEDLLDSLSPIR
jgi:hypothetical protein